MQYLSRSRLPVFTPRLDLTAEDLNAEAETLCAAINELAGRLFIIKDMIPKEERAQYAEEESYPILDEIERIWEDIQRAWETIEKNKEECEAHYEETMARITELDDRLNNLIQAVKQELLNIINAVDKKHDDEEERIENKFDISLSDLEKRFNALDDAAARKADLAKLFDRIQYIQDNSLPKIGSDGYWYIGKIRTNTLARGPQGEQGPTGDSGVYIGEKAPTNGANVWIDPTGEGEDTPVDYGIGWGIAEMEPGDISNHEDEYFAKYGAIITRLPLPEVTIQGDSAPAENFVVNHEFENDVRLETSFDIATKTITGTMINISDHDQYFSGLMVRDPNWNKALWMGPQKTVKPGKSVTTTLVLTSEDYLQLTADTVLYTVQYCEPLNEDNSREVVLIGGTEVLTNSSKDNAKHLLYPSYVEEGQWFDPTHKLVCVYAMGTEAKPENIIKVILMGKEIAFQTDIPSLNDYALRSEIPSLEGYATEDFVNNAINNISVSSIYTMDFINNTITDTVILETAQAIYEEIDKNNLELLISISDKFSAIDNITALAHYVSKDDSHIIFETDRTPVVENMNSYGYHALSGVIITLTINFDADGNVVSINKSQTKKALGNFISCGTGYARYYTPAYDSSPISKGYLDTRLQEIDDNIGVINTQLEEIINGGE